MHPLIKCPICDQDCIQFDPSYTYCCRDCSVEMHQTAGISPPQWLFASASNTEGCGFDMSESIDWQDIIWRLRENKQLPLKIQPTGSNTGTEPLVNNYVCTRCKNDRLSTSETQCWWCEEPIKIKKEDNENSPIWRI